jgi:hypothetical protein
MCVCVCIYAQVHSSLLVSSICCGCLYRFMYMYVYTYIIYPMHLCWSPHVCICIFIHQDPCIIVIIHIHTHTRMYTLPYTHITQIHKRARTHTHARTNNILHVSLRLYTAIMQVCNYRHVCVCLSVCLHI